MARFGRHRITILVLVALLSGIAGFRYFGTREDVAFPDLQGPDGAAEVAVSPPPTDPAAYRLHGSASHAAAILLTDTSSSWLGLAHGLKTMGVPFTIVTDIDEALEHDVVIVYPALTGSSLPPHALQALAAHVRSGGTLVGFSVIGGGMPPVFGFDRANEDARRREMVFTDSPWVRRFAADALERRVPLAPPSGDGSPVLIFAGEKLEPVARYRDGGAAIVMNRFDADGRTGRAYAVGFDIGHYVLRATNGRFAEMVSSYTNTYQPQVDTLLRFLKTVYREGEPDAVTLGFTPHGRDVTIVMTHDIDFTRSMDNVRTYADYESGADIPATYFIQTKYMTDYNDRAFFGPSRQEDLRYLEARGMEIASHGVSHSNEFRSMPLGTGLERYPDYEPFVESFTEVRDGSVLGELRVSKFLLESLSASNVSSFRPGHLSHPDFLPEALDAVGYRNSSSMTANEAMTHFPYQLTHSRGYATEVDVFEFPITIEDEYGSLTDRIDASIALADRIASRGGLVNVLIHTDVAGEKLAFEKRFVEAFRDRAWFSTLGDFGEWWRARDEVTLEVVRESDDRRLLILEAPFELEGLTLQVPERWQLVHSPVAARQEGTAVVVEALSGVTRLPFHVRSVP